MPVRPYQRADRTVKGKSGKSYLIRQLWLWPGRNPCLKGETWGTWRAHYYDVNISGEDAREEIIRYIHRNPVKRGLIGRPHDYRWSSFQHYITGHCGTVEIESEWTARRREPTHPDKAGMNGAQGS